MTKAIRIQKPGGPEEMQWVTVSLGEPGLGEARVRIRAAGLNFIDCYHRSGLYPQPMPAGIGLEGAGDVVSVGADVTHVKAGDRVVFADLPPGSYAEERVMPARTLVRLPDAIDYETAAAMMLKGLTVQYLFRRTYRLQKGQTILFHAAAGGVGLFALQWAKALGVTVIGTVGSEQKAQLATEYGCDHVIRYDQENIVERVREITAGAMVPVVYDSVGKDTFTASLDCLQPFGTMVSFGNASGPVPPVALTALKGSLYLTRPSLMAHTSQRPVLEEMAADLFEQVTSGRVKIRIDQRYPMAEAARAHRDLEARRTTGQTLLVP